MTRTFSILTGALIALSAVAPVLAARALGSFETRAPVAAACLDAPAVAVAPVAPQAVEPNSCSAEQSEVQP
jgi:hypothetical protein